MALSTCFATAAETHRLVSRPLFIAFARLRQRFVQARHVRGIQRRSTGASTTETRFERWRKPLLTCGILAGVLYFAMTLFVGMLWDGYSAADQTISELSAIGAPTRPIWMALAAIYSALMTAFGWIVWKSAPHRGLRIVGALLFTQAVFGIFWPPMHQRAVLAAGNGTLTDTFHIVWTIVTSLFFMTALGFGAAAFGRRFRLYSLATMVIVFACGAWTGTYAPAIQGNLPTPWVGVWERINTNAFMLWIVILAAVLIRARTLQERKSMSDRGVATDRPPQGTGPAGRVSQYANQLWQAPLAGVLLRKGRQVIPHASAFRTPRGEAAFLAAYDGALKLWPVPHEEIDVPTRFGTTHVVVCGSTTAPPLVLLHGYMATATMWSPNIAAFSQHYRVYAIDVMGQPSKSRPDEPIRDVADFVSWLTATLDALDVNRAFLVGMSFGGWLALNYAVAVPERVHKLVLLSPGGLLPMVRQFTVRGMLMVWLPTRLTVNSFFRWLGFTDPAYANVLEMMYLGLKHFRMPFETARVMPAVVPDEALRTIEMPTLLLIGEHEVISDPASALQRASRLIQDFEGGLVPACRHDMCSSQHDVVDARVLEFLKKTRPGDHAATAERSVA